MRTDKTPALTSWDYKTIASLKRGEGHEYARWLWADKQNSNLADVKDGVIALHLLRMCQVYNILDFGKFAESLHSAFIAYDCNMDYWKAVCEIAEKAIRQAPADAFPGYTAWVTRHKIELIPSQTNEYII